MTTAVDCLPWLWPHEASSGRGYWLSVRMHESGFTLLIMFKTQNFLWFWTSLLMLRKRIMHSTDTIIVFLVMSRKSTKLRVQYRFLTLNSYQLLSIHCRSPTSPNFSRFHSLSLFLCWQLFLYKMNVKPTVTLRRSLPLKCVTSLM